MIKCEFDKQYFLYLRSIVGGGELKIDLEKFISIMEILKFFYPSMLTKEE